ncbi:MAG TPA: arginine--tRNA ligase, partial [Candidatus Saccharimonadales bacterium]|nr:arginine--tRNA ligase [Candidatus Saccharimonadales bacterium]
PLFEALSMQVAEITIAGPGFINIRLSDQTIFDQALAAPSTKLQTFAGQTVVSEYSDPNPFKVLHAGHLYTSVVGDAISRLIQAAGGEVHAVNFGGDVGLHVGKTMWAIVQDVGGEKPELLQNIAPAERAEWMAKKYVVGTQAYETDEQAKTQIIELNKRVYQVHAEGDTDTPFAQMYWTCRQWSYDYFNEFYARLGTAFEKYYPESQTAPIGVATVKEQLAKGVYQESDGAIVFVGEPYGLHTRVFINSAGLPTYEAKDVGLMMAKWHDYHFDKSIIITGNDIIEYMKVVLKSIEQFAPEFVQRTTHLTHGQVKLEGGVKMSSRKGNFLRAVDVLDAAAKANKQATGRDDEQAVLGAVKYAFLKQRIGPDIIYNPEESVSLEGNSGPYLMYAHARARSILAKAASPEYMAGDEGFELQPLERSLARDIARYPQVVQKAVTDLMPHHICTYLYELAQTFNRFYEKNRVIGDPREAQRLVLVALYADVLKDGLQLLGIVAPNRL